MTKLFLCLASLISAAWAAEICCPSTGCYNNNYPFNHLPLPRCENTIDPRFLVFTRSNRDSAQRMTRSSIPSVFRTSRRTFFLIHGYTNDENTTWLRNMKNALLSQGDYNVVVVGWGGGSQTLWYPQAASNTRAVGAETAAVTQNLRNRGVSRSNLVCIGHSLGAHTCGHAGERTRWGRISGLDPAGPLFENYPSEARLNPGDADLVDVIHTMGQQGFILDFGTLTPLGHMDFYPAGGKIQPGCINKEHWHGDNEVTGDIIGCSHARAVTYYVESIARNCFKVRQQCTNEQNLPGSCYTCGSNCHSMGFRANTISRNGKFYIDVNSRAPFCQN